MYCSCKNLLLLTFDDEIIINGISIVSCFLLEVFFANWLYLSRKKLLSWAYKNNFQFPLVLFTRATEIPLSSESLFCSISSFIQTLAINRRKLFLSIRCEQNTIKILYFNFKFFISSSCESSLAALTAHTPLHFFKLCVIPEV